MALAAVQCQPEERLARVFDQIFLPCFVVPFEPASNKVSGRDDVLIIGRQQLIRRQHFDDHLMVGFVLVQRLHDPVFPSPDHGIAVHHIGHGSAAIPVAITPDVHPVSSPAFTMLR